MVEWATLPIDMLVLIAARVSFFEDFVNFCVVCKSWYSITSILGKSRSLPPRFPWVMLTDKAETNFPALAWGNSAIKMLLEQVGKNEHIDGMHKRGFFSFSTCKTYDFELPEATRRKCLGVSYGWLLTIGYDLQINLLHPFTRQQIAMPPLLSFKNQFQYNQNSPPQRAVSFFVRKAVMSSNIPHNTRNEDCIVLAIAGQFELLGFARPGDKAWTDICVPSKSYRDVVYYKGKFYAIDHNGLVFFCDINNVNGPKATPIACTPDGLQKHNIKYLVELSKFLLIVVRFWTWYCDDLNNRYRTHRRTIGFSIFKLEEGRGDKSSNIYPYKMTEVKSLGDNALFIGYNASVSVPSSKGVKANCIYFSDHDASSYPLQPYGGGRDTGIFDVESNRFNYHYASLFASHITPPMWFI